MSDDDDWSQIMLLLYLQPIDFYRVLAYMLSRAAQGATIPTMYNDAPAGIKESDDWIARKRAAAIRQFDDNLRGMRHSAIGRCRMWMHAICMIVLSIIILMGIYRHPPGFISSSHLATTL